MEEKKKLLSWKEKMLIAVVFLFLCCVAIIVGAVIKTNEWDKPITIDNWLIYYGTIGGALVGGFITAVGLYLTLKQNSITLKEDKLNSIMPILTLDKADSFDYDLYTSQEEIGNSSGMSPALIIKNIGSGPSMNIKISINDIKLLSCSNTQFVFNLGVHESKNVQVFTKKEFDDETNFKIECNDIYSERKYIYNYKINLASVKNGGYNFTYNGVEVEDIGV